MRRGAVRRFLSCGLFLEQLLVGLPLPANSQFLALRASMRWDLRCLAEAPVFFLDAYCNDGGGDRLLCVGLATSFALISKHSPWF